MDHIVRDAGDVLDQLFIFITGLLSSALVSSSAEGSMPAANNANVIWLERNVWAGNKEGIRHCQQFVINYEDSIHRRYEMEQRAARNDSTAKRLMRESEQIRKNLR